VTERAGGASGLSPAKRELLERALRRGRGSTGPAQSIPRRSAEGPAPLSVGQEQIWFFERLSPELGVYNEGASIRKTGELDLGALRAAFNHVVRRHEIWRTTFPLADGTPVQRVEAEAAGYELPLTDLTHLPPPLRMPEAIRLATEDARQPYKLGVGPLVRPRLVRLAEDDHGLFLAMHHMVFDGVSLYRVLLPELIALYKAYASGLHAELPALAVQYSDFAQWQHDRWERPEVAQRVAYWCRQLHGELPDQLPTDHERPSVQRFRGAIKQLEIERELVSTLRQLARHERASQFMVLASAFTVLLHRYSGQNDIVFGTPIDDRDRPELQGMIGFCLNAVVLRVDAGGDPSFRELISRVREVTLEAVANEVPFERLVRELQPRRDPSRNPLFQVMFGIEPPVPDPDPEWSLHQMEEGVGTAKFDLYLELDERPEGHISCRFVYSTDLFEQETIARMKDHWLNLLRRIAAEPDRPISQAPLLSDAERRQLLIDWNSTQTEIPKACVHQLIEAQVHHSPSSTAVVFEDRQLTYRELDLYASRLAQRLVARGVGPGSTVGICVDRSLDMLVAPLAVMKAGGAYLPLDPRHPADRLAYMLQDSGASLVITHTDWLGVLSTGQTPVMCLDQDNGSVTLPATQPKTEVGPEHLAVVIYTSGSTGRPKGVEIPHRAMVNLLRSMAVEPGLASDDVLLAVTTLSFDIAGLELYLPLICGARVVIANRDQASDGARLARLLASSAATVMQATPTSWRMLVESGWNGSSDLTALSGGEALSADLAHALLSRCRRLYNMYGPTETTIWSTVAPIERRDRISIGRPIANTRVYVLDRHRQPVPIGVPGELYIGGDGLARGYVGRPDLTAERFVTISFGVGRKERLYRTDDAARWRSDGALEYLGRLDDQLKIRGHRIELAEVEAVLADHPSVSAAVAVGRQAHLDGAELVAYIVPAPGRAPTVGELREHLRSRLPDYMLPSAIAVLDALPVTANGKVDRKGLAARNVAMRPAPGSTHEGPRTPTEEALVQIWRAALGVERIGIRENFFELGGHSLLAVRVLAEVERVTGRRPPLATFFREGVTVEGQAQMLEQEIDSGTSAQLVRVQPNGQRLPVFFVFSDESALLSLRNFLPALGPNQPVYGLIPERNHRRFDRHRKVEELASRLCRLAEEVQPHGPYYICGHSFGGLIAYEVASQLRAGGEQVGMLALIDTLTPDAERHALREWMRPRARLGRQLRRGLRLGAAKLWEMAHRETRAGWSQVLGTADGQQAGDFDYDGAIYLARQYHLVGSDVPLSLYHIAQERSAGGACYRLGWEEVHRGSLECEEIPGDHLSMLQVPNVTLLAERLATRLRAVQGFR
jgi:amino acid adenylation domain-containing protein